MKEYGATKGATFGKERAQIYGKALEDIERKKGKITPKAVVDEARDKSSPLHDYFDWDVSTASEKYWLYQARTLINHITVVVNYETGDEQKAFFNVREEMEDAKTVYVNIERALSDRDMRGQILQNALAELQYWKQKYKEYSEFRGIVNAIDKLDKRLKKK